MSGSGSRLDGLTKGLRERWQQTKDSWRDAKSVEFERNYLEDLQLGVDRTITVIDELEKLIAKIRKDCE